MRSKKTSLRHISSLAQEPFHLPGLSMGLSQALALKLFASGEDIELLCGQVFVGK